MAEGAPRDMTRWLGDGGMAIIAALGASFDGFGASGAHGGAGAHGSAGVAGASGADEGGAGEGGWSSATWRPTTLACNPQGIVQAGVHAVVLDAAMNFAINAGLSGRDRARATLEMKTETMRAAQADAALTVRGHVTRLARQVAYTEAIVRDDQGRLVSRATGTFLLHRET